MAKRGPRSLNRGLISHSFIQLFRDFGYWPLNRGWLLNGGWTVLLCCCGDLTLEQWYSIYSSFTNAMVSLWYHKSNKLFFHVFQ